MDRRYSLNGTCVSSPIAESTCLNGTNSGTTFPWGATAISPKHRSNSVCMDKSSSLLSRSRINQTQSPVRAKIDPRIYADVQSRGLASRIVQYHEDGQRLNRSMSVNNIYSKPGQFPIVHLNARKDLPYKASNQNVSMTRIAPPKESMYCGNTLSSLLRSSSIIGLQKTDELSHENRPILHPPPTENDLAPTRSVIDVLKEISRKRINSDDREQKETNKKYCNRDYIDHIDNETELTNGKYSSAVTPSSYKRQRERLSSPQRTVNRMSMTKDQNISSQQHSPEQIAKKRQCTYNNDISSSLSSSLIQNNKRKLNETTKSPPLQRSNKTISVNDVYSVQKSKILRYQQPDLRLENISKSLSCNTPITPIPNTPYNQQKQPIEQNECVPAQRAVSAPIYSTIPVPMKQNIKPKLTLFNTNCDDDEKPEVDPKCGTHIDADDDEGIQFIKPKKTQSSIGTKNALIERTKQSKLASLLAGLRGELYEDNDEIDSNSNNNAGSGRMTNLNASKEITITTESQTNATTSAALTLTTNTTNSTTTTTSVIGINGLKNTANNNMTNLNVSQPPNGTDPAIIKPIDGTSAETSATGGFKFDPSSSMTNKSDSTASPIPGGGGFKFSPPSSTSTNTDNKAISLTPSVSTLNNNPPTKSPPKVTSPLVGLKLTPQTNQISSTTAPTLQTTTVSTVPMLSGFSFNANNCTSNITTSTTPVNNMQTTSALNMPAAVGSTSTTTATGVSLVAPKPAFTFGTIPNETRTTTPTATTVTTTFGSIAANNTGQAPAFGEQSQLAADATKPFSFGAAKPDISSTQRSASAELGTTPALSATNSVFGIAKPPAISFPFSSTATISSTSTTTTTNTSTANTNLFNFGSAITSSDTTKPTASAGPFSFNNIAPAPEMAKSTATSSHFTFGGAATTTADTSAPKTFSFNGAFGGTANTSAQPTSTPSNSIFGSAAVTKEEAAKNASSTLFAFGGNRNGTTAPSASNSIFGSKTNTQNMPFTFGTTTNNNAAANVNQLTNSPFGNAASTNSTAQVLNTNAPFAFGNPTGAAVPATPDTSKPSLFAFGTNTNQTAKTAPGSTLAEKNIFGSATAATNSFGNTAAPTGVAQAAFSFNSGSNTATVATPNNTFAALASGSNQSKTFTFGTTNVTNKATQPSAIFGTTTTNDSKPFAFGAATNAVTSPFNKPTTATPFAFGNSNNNSTAGTFTFGANNNNTTNAQAASNPTAAAKPFAFGSTGNTVPQNNATPSSNIFGASNSILGAPPAGSAPITPVAPATNNVFAPPPSAQGERIIRRATRRLHK